MSPRIPAAPAVFPLKPVADTASRRDGKALRRQSVARGVYHPQIGGLDRRAEAADVEQRRRETVFGQFTPKASKALRIARQVQSQNFILLQRIRDQIRQAKSGEQA